jgi:hypothetical protein
MWLLLAGLAVAEEPDPDWGVPTHFPEVHERVDDEAPVVKEAPRLPEAHPRRRGVGRAALLALMVAGGWMTLGYGVAGAHAALDF